MAEMIALGRLGTSRVGQPENRQIVRLGSATGEDHSIGPPAVQSAPSIRPISSRASSSTRRARRPAWCWLAGLA